MRCTQCKMYNWLAYIVESRSRLLIIDRRNAVGDSALVSLHRGYSMVFWWFSGIMNLALCTDIYEIMNYHYRIDFMMFIYWIPKLQYKVDSACYNNSSRDFNIKQFCSSWNCSSTDIADNCDSIIVKVLRNSSDIVKDRP